MRNKRSRQILLHNIFGVVGVRRVDCGKSRLVFKGGVASIHECLVFEGGVASIHECLVLEGGVASIHECLVLGRSVKVPNSSAKLFFFGEENSSPQTRGHVDVRGQLDVIRFDNNFPVRIFDIPIGVINLTSRQLDLHLGTLSTLLNKSCPIALITSAKGQISSLVDWKAWLCVGEVGREGVSVDVKLNRQRNRQPIDEDLDFLKEFFIAILSVLIINIVCTGSKLETMLELWRIFTVTNLDAWETFGIESSDNLTLFIF